MTLIPVGSTAAVLSHHLGCFGKGDLEGILSDYAADAFILTQSGAFRGREAMSAFFSGMFAEFAKPGASFTMQQQTVEGDAAFITWSAETADNSYEFGTDTFLIHDGRILVQTFAAKTSPKH
jgi:ketosteroid isomerase-like protein